jgi:hypothetical protein
VIAWTEYTADGHSRRWRGAEATIAALEEVVRVIYEERLPRSVQHAAG